MIIASLKSDMAYLTQSIKEMDDKAKKKVEELLQIAQRDKLSIPENVQLFIDLYSYLSTQLQKQEQKLLKDLKTRIIKMEERLKKDIMRWLKGI